MHLFVHSMKGSGSCVQGAAPCKMQQAQRGCILRADKLQNAEQLSPNTSHTVSTLQPHPHATHKWGKKWGKKETGVEPSRLVVFDPATPPHPWRRVLGVGKEGKQVWGPYVDCRRKLVRSLEQFHKLPHCWVHPRVYLKHLRTAVNRFISGGLAQP